MKKLLLILKLSLLEFRNKRMVFLNVLLILVLGALAPIIVSALKSSTDEFLQGRSREILSADVTISGITEFTSEQKKQITDEVDFSRESSEIQFLTMARSEKSTMLVDVKAVSETYPLFGNIRLVGVSGNARTSDLKAQKIAWVQRDVLDALGLKIGDAIHLGRSDFKVEALILSDSVLPQGSMSFAPRIYIGENFVAETKLNQFGSQIFYRLHYELKDSENAEEIGEDLKDVFHDPNIYVRTPHDAIEGLNRFIDFFSRYLSIMTLVVFSIALVSAFYIFQSLNQSHLKQSAIIMTLGGSRLVIGFIYLLQSLFLSTLAFLVATGLSYFILKILQVKYHSSLPEGFEFHLFADDLLRLFSVLLLTSICFVLTLILKISRLNIQILLSESNQSSEKMHWGDLLILYFFILGVFVSLSYYLMGSQNFAIFFVVSLIVSALVSLYFGRGLFFLFKRSVSRTPGMLRVLSINLSSKRFAGSLCFIAIALVAIVLNIVPHLMSSLRQDIAPITGHQLPSLFVFNVPDERLSELEAFAAENKKELKFVSPLILARMTLVNGVPPSQDFFLKYPVRISYRKEMIPSERMIEGEPLPPVHQEGDPVYVSLEQGFSERWGIHIGDKLSFDVAGVPFEAIVRNLRIVRWSDFNPNFYFEFQGGVLDDAPKTWLANLQLGDSDETSHFENILIQKFPDISVIDIRKSVAEITDIVGGLIVPAGLLTGLSAVLSLLILGFVIWHHLLSRADEIEMVKILGKGPGQVARLFISEYMILTFCALVTGSAAGLGIAYYVCRRFLKVEVVFAWKEMALSTSALLVVMFLICFFLVSRMMKTVGGVRS